MYIVTDQPKGFPTIDKLISRNGSHELRPTTNDIDIISTAEAKKRFGDLVGVIPGTSWAITGFENCTLHDYIALPYLLTHLYERNLPD
jgi:hypothetical protein